MATTDKTRQTLVDSMRKTKGTTTETAPVKKKTAAKKKPAAKKKTAAATKAQPTSPAKEMAMNTTTKTKKSSDPFQSGRRICFIRYKGVT